MQNSYEATAGMIAGLSAYDFQFNKTGLKDTVDTLKEKDKNASKEWLNKLPQMVKQLEVSLYRSAPSFEAYADTSTLKHRLQLLAMEIATI